MSNISYYYWGKPTVASTSDFNGSTEICQDKVLLTSHNVRKYYIKNNTDRHCGENYWTNNNDLSRCSPHIVSLPSWDAENECLIDIVSDIHNIPSALHLCRIHVPTVQIAVCHWHSGTDLRGFLLQDHGLNLHPVDCPSYMKQQFNDPPHSSTSWSIIVRASNNILSQYMGSWLYKPPACPRLGRHCRQMKIHLPHLPLNGICA